MHRSSEIVKVVFMDSFFNHQNGSRHDSKKSQDTVCFKSCYSKTFVSILISGEPLPTTSQTTNQTSSVVEGGNVTITCEVESYPLASVTWYRPNGSVVVENAHTSIVNNVTSTKFSHIINSRLEITEAQMDWDNGNFRCEANNTIGSENIVIAVQLTSCM